MTTMISPRGQHNPATRVVSVTRVVSPAATWNGGLERRPTEVRTHSNVRPGAVRTITTPRQRKQARRDAFGQFALGGVLGLTAIIGMLVANGGTEEVVPTSAHVAVATVGTK